MLSRVLVPVAAATIAFAGPVAAEVRCGENLPAADPHAPSRMSAPDFIREVTAKEVEAGRAFATFGYTVEATVQTLDGDRVDGEFRQVATLSFDEQGPKRTVAEGAVNTLTRIKFADRDIDALRDALTLTPERVSTGDIVYSGRQRVEPINAALFDILPRNAAGELHGFVGRTWVRQRDDSVMRLCGRSSGTPIAPMRFEAVRGLVAERYWFPVLIRADEDVRIDDATVHVRVTIKYSNYKAR
jgi:hypothetical protein